MIATKPVIWAAFVGLTAATVVGTVLAWHWVSYGHLTVDHPPTDVDVPIVEAVDMKALQVPATTHPSQVATKASPPARPTPKESAHVIKPAPNLRICWRSHMRAGVDCYLVEWKPGPPGISRHRCRQCTY